MPKKKLQRFAELETLERVFQPKGFYLDNDHELKGKWKSEVFANDHPIVLELGCGRGEYTIEMAKRSPEKNFIGIDIKGARLWRGAKTANEDNMMNVAFLRVQIEQLSSFFVEREINEIWITFPDPQPQDSRENRRLTSERFLSMYKKMLVHNGYVHLKTDSFFLYEYTMESAIKAGAKILTSTNDLYAETLPDEILSVKTTYEKKFLEKGSKICYLKFSF
jgi:tRNA (guanine-N7-)-methyltransferase